MPRIGINYNDNKWHDGIKKLQNGKWQYRIYYVDPITGKHRETVGTCQTKGECRQQREIKKQKLKNDSNFAPNNTTVSQLVHDYIDRFKGAHSTKKSYISCAKYIDEMIGNTKISQFTEYRMQCFVDELQKRPRQRQKNDTEIEIISGKTVRNTVALLQAAFRDAVRFRWTERNPTIMCGLPPKEKPEIQVFSNDECKQFIQRVQGDEYKLIYIIDLLTGMRESEIIGLTWSAVDFTKGIIKIEKQLKKIDGKSVFVPLKYRSTRTIKPAQHVMNLLQQRQQEQMNQKKKAGILWDNHLNLVFTNEVGQPIAVSTLYRHYKRIVEDMGCPELRIHDLRHTYAVNSLLAGDDIKTISANLGHKSVAFTMDEYAGFTDDMRNLSYERQNKMVDDWGL